MGGDGEEMLPTLRGSQDQRGESVSTRGTAALTEKQMSELSPKARL